MLKLVYITFTILLAMTSLANARIVTCDFDRWAGGKTEEASISWTGLKAELDHSKSTVRRVWSGGVENQWYSTEVRKTQDFTTYVFFRETEDVKGKKFRMRFSYRFYKRGRCEAHISLDDKQYMDMRASGRWDR